MDVGTVFHDNQFQKYNVSLCGYGYYGDCLVGSESNRWMGPKRYDWEGLFVIVNCNYHHLLWYCSTVHIKVLKVKENDSFFYLCQCFKPYDFMMIQSK